MKITKHTIKDARGPADGAAPAFVNADAGEKVRSAVVETPRIPAGRVAPSGAAAREKHDAVHRREKFIDALDAVRAKLDAILVQTRALETKGIFIRIRSNRVAKDRHFGYVNTFLLHPDSKWLQRAAVSPEWHHFLLVRGQPPPFRRD